MQTDVDILIIGGGMVGASLACALHGSSLRIGVIEAVPLAASDQPSYDDRTIALDANTGKLLWDFPTDAAVNATASTFAPRRSDVADS